MDINGFSLNPLNMADSNPGRVQYCPGGVGRNIAENLHRLGEDVRFIGVIGDDPGGELIRNSGAHIGLNIEHSLFPKNGITSVYIALMDSDGEMKLALADMDIMEQMTVEHLESKAGIIEESAIVLLDTNLPERIISFILERFSGDNSANGESSAGKSPLFFLDAVSARKAPRAASRIGSFDTIKLGRMEASVLSGIGIGGAGEKLKEAADHFLDKGARRVFITMGKEGVYAASAKGSLYRPVYYTRPLNTSGGGDAFMAGIVYGAMRGWDEEEIVSFSLAMARLTVRSKSVVAPEICLELVKNEESKMRNKE